MIAFSVSEISALGGFCDEEQQYEEELGILVVGYISMNFYLFHIIKFGFVTIYSRVTMNVDIVVPS